MKSITNLTFEALALAVTLLFQTSTARADTSAPIRLTFDKTFAGAGPAPYLSHFNGTFDGDFTGTLYVGVLVRELIDARLQIVHLEADYVFTDVDGNYLFTAHVEGTSNAHAGKAVLTGVVTDGAFAGARVHDEFDILGGGHFRGTIRIMPASAD